MYAFMYICICVYLCYKCVYMYAYVYMCMQCICIYIIKAIHAHYENMTIFRIVQKTT